MVVKTFPADAHETSAPPAEIQLASVPRHDNIAATISIGQEAGRHFIVSEYLEGTTLRKLLHWLGSRSESLPDAAVVRILLGIFAAVEHGHRWARTPAARALVHQVIAADDVFITYEGNVKLLGFKPQRPLSSTERASNSAEVAAVDGLLSAQRSPELAAVLARAGARVSAASMLGLWQITRALHTWQQDELETDGRSELAAVMAGVLPGGRATRRALLDAACERVVRARTLVIGDSGSRVDDNPPVSGYQVTGSDLTITMDGDTSSSVTTSSVTLAPLPGEHSTALQTAAVLLGSSTSGVHSRRRRARPLVLGTLALAGLFGLCAYALRSAPEGTSAMRADVTPPPWAEEKGGGAAASDLPHSSPTAAAMDAATGPVMTLPSNTQPTHLPPARGSAARWKASGKPRVSSSRVAPPAARPGYLTLDSTPWSRVSLGNTTLGHTPLVKIELPPGEHELELENEELGIVSSVLVDIVSDLTTVRRIGLERPIHAASR